MHPGPTSGRRSPAIWIALALAAIVGVIAAAASTRGARGIPAASIERDHVAPAPSGAAPATIGDASRLVSIEMYSAAWCAACGRAKAWMREHDVAYHEVDVDRRAGALAQLQMLNPRASLPTFDVDGQVVVGFQEARLRSAIDDAARRHR